MTVTRLLTDSSDTTGKPLTISVETAIYLLILVLALGLRAPLLGEVPLNDLEAGHAAAALFQIQGRAITAETIQNPVLHGATSLLFSIAGPSNAAARALSLLAGVALVFTPLLFKNYLGRFATLISMLWLATSPVAVQSSREVTGISIGLVALIVFLAAIDKYLRDSKSVNLIAAGVLLGLVVLSDYAMLLALLAIGLGFVFARITDEDEELTTEHIHEVLSNIRWEYFIVGFVATIILVGTAFFTSPGTLGAAADFLVSFITGVVVKRHPGAHLGFTLAIYETVLVLFGLLGGWQASLSDSPRIRLLAGWGVTAILLSLIYQNAQPTHALLAVLPLALLAGLAVERLFSINLDTPDWLNGVFIAITIALLTISFAGVITYLRSSRNFPVNLSTPFGPFVEQLPLDLILAALWGVLLVILVFTANFTWGRQVTQRSLGTTLLLLGLVFGFSNSVSLAFTTPSSPYWILKLKPAQPSLNVMVETASEISRIATGTDYEASLIIQATESSALGWATRNFSNKSYVDFVNPGIETIMVITPSTTTTPELGSNYVGQDFVVSSLWLPTDLTPQAFLRWAIYNSANTAPVEERYILWVREDIYQISIEP